MLVARAPFNAHTEPLFKQEEILRFEDLYTFSQLQFMHAYSYGLLPHSFDGTWPLNCIKNTATAGLRKANKLYEPKARLEFAERLPLHTFPKLCNELNDTKLKNTANVKSFNSGLKQYFLEDLASNVKCKRSFCKDCFRDNSNLIWLHYLFYVIFIIHQILVWLVLCNNFL